MSLIPSSLVAYRSLVAFRVPIGALVGPWQIYGESLVSLWQVPGRSMVRVPGRSLVPLVALSLVAWWHIGP
jgi:hypothetical protein